MNAITRRIRALLPAAAVTAAMAAAAAAQQGAYERPAEAAEMPETYLTPETYPPPEAYPAPEVYPAPEAAAAPEPAAAPPAYEPPPPPVETGYSVIAYTGYPRRRGAGFFAGERFDYYLAPKYQLPLGTPVPWGGVSVEAGLIWGNGAFIGLDLNFGLRDHSDGYYYDYDYDRADNETGGCLIGGGVGLGYTHGVGGNRLQLSYGASAGLWWAREWRLAWEWYDEDSGPYDPAYGYGGHPVRAETDAYNFLAPFIKLRWSFVEVTYRGLLGIKDSRNGGGGFGYNNHQLMAGLYVATSKRAGR